MRNRGNNLKNNNNKRTPSYTAPLSLSISRPYPSVTYFTARTSLGVLSLFHESDYLRSSSSIQDGSWRRKHLGNRSSVSISVWDESLPPALRMVGRRNVVATQLWSGIMGRKQRIGFRFVRSNENKKKEASPLSPFPPYCDVVAKGTRRAMSWFRRDHQTLTEEGFLWEARFVWNTDNFTDRTP